MNPLILAQLLIQYGPSAIEIVQKLLEDINSGKTATTVTAADLAELKRLRDLTSAGIYASLGIKPPA